MSKTLDKAWVSELHWKLTRSLQICRSMDPPLGTVLEQLAPLSKNLEYIWIDYELNSFLNSVPQKLPFGGLLFKWPHYHSRSIYVCVYCLNSVCQRYSEYLLNWISKNVEDIWLLARLKLLNSRLSFGMRFYQIFGNKKPSQFTGGLLISSFSFSLLKEK